MSAAQRKPPSSPIADRIRAYVRERHDAKPEERYSARKLSAAALDNPTQLSNVLKRLDHGGDVSHEVLRALAETMGRSLGWLLGDEAAGPRLADLPGWEDAVRGAYEQFPTLMPEDVETIGAIRAPKPPPVTPRLVVALALVWRGK